MLDSFISSRKQSNSTEAYSYAFDLPESDTALFELTKYPLLDVAEGIRTTGSEDMLRKILNLFLDQSLPADIEKMKEAYEAADWEKTQNFAHKIKWGLVYIGATRFKMACQYLERYWKTGQTTLLEQLYQQSLKVMDESVQEISSWLQQNKS